METKIERFKVTGAPQKDYLPKLVNSVAMGEEDHKTLLTVGFETNPMDTSCDTRIEAKSRPLEFIYDAVRNMYKSSRPDPLENCHFTVKKLPKT